MTPVLKLLITGSMGAGKTTAVSAISEIDSVRTEVPISGDVVREDKTTTTVGLDYGELTLEDGRKLAIFGTPGQARYEFMCRILARSAVGLVILIDHTSADAAKDLAYYLRVFSDLIDQAGAVVGITRTDLAEDVSLDCYYAVLDQTGRALPVCAVDVRRREDVAMLLETLLATQEYS